MMTAVLATVTPSIVTPNAPSPVVTLSGAGASPESAFLGTITPLTVTFANASTLGAVGYVPFVALELPVGITLDGSVTYLGQTVQSQVVTVDANGDASYTVNGQSFSVSGLAPGSSVAILEPPFGSFAAGQTPASMQLNLAVSPTASLGAALQVAATAGFAWGSTDAGPGAPVVQPAASAATLAITPQLLTVTSTYEGPLDKLATGPGLQAAYGGPPPTSTERFDINSTIAPGQTIDNLTLTDVLPPSATATEIELVDGAATYTYAIDAATGVMTEIGTGGPSATPDSKTGAFVAFDAATNTVTADFGNVVGNGATGGGPEIEAFFNVGLDQGLGTATQTGTTAQPLVVTDMLPFGAVAQTFTLTGIDGVTYTYSYSPTAGVQLVSGNVSTAPTQATSPTTIGANEFYYDVVNGNITGDFGTPTANGQTATITAQWSGGQAQLPGVVSGNANGSGELSLVDQLNGTATLETFTITTPGGVATYVWNGSSLSETGVIPSDAALAVNEAGAAASSVSTVYYDATNHRIVTNFQGLAANAAVAIAAVFSGGQTVSQTTAANYELSNSASASGAWAVAGATSENVSASSGSDQVSAQAITLEKRVVDDSVTSKHAIQPGDQLTWTLTAQFSNYFDLGNVTINDTMSDGQSFDYNQPVVLTVSQLGEPSVTLTLNSDEYQVAATTNPNGSTNLVFNVSQALIDDKLAGDINGGAAPDDASPSTANAATLSLSYGSTIDTAWNVASGPYTKQVGPTNFEAAYQVEQGDTITNAAIIKGTVLDATGAPTTTVASDAAGAGIEIPTGSVAKVLYAVTRDGSVLWQASATDQTYNGTIQTGDQVTYELVYNLPAARAADLQLTDFLPLPVYLEADPNGQPSGGSGFAFNAASTFDLNSDLAAGTGTALPAAGTIEYDNDSLATQYLFDGTTPTLTNNAATNSFSLDFGEVYSATPVVSPNINLDLVYTTTVQDASFGNGLQLTNQVTSTEYNTAGTPTVNNAYAQMTLAAPALKIEKAVVATTDSHGVFLDANGKPIQTGGAVSLGGVQWNASGTFSGTLDSATLASDPASDTLADVGGGETIEYALVVQNLGASSGGAYDVTLHDTAIPAGMSLVPNSIQVLDGTGSATVPYTLLGNGLFDPNGGIQIGNSTDDGYAMGADANDGSNVFVVEYALQTSPTVTTPDLVLPDTATITSFSDEPNGVNRISTISSADANASSAVVTATPTLTKQVIATSDSSTGSDSGSLRIGESVTYAVTATLPGGTATGVVLSDPLPAGLSLVGATIETLGSDISASLSAGSSNTSGTFDLGSVSVASDSRGVNDQITVLVTAIATSASATITNTATIAEANPNGGTLTETASATVGVLAPSLSITKTVTDERTGQTGSGANAISVQGGDTLDYNVDLTDAAGAGNAYQVAVTDALNALGIGTDVDGNSNLSLIAGSFAQVGSGGTLVVNGATLAIDAATLDAGGTLDFDFKAIVSAQATFDASITNTATYTAQTLSATDAAYGLGGVENLTGTASATADVFQPTLTKVLTSGSDSNIKLPYLAVGETGTFTISAALPEGDSSDFKVVDVLPAGLSFAGVVTPSLQGVTAGLADPSAVVNGNTVTFDFGALESPGTNGLLTLGVEATVQNVSATQVAGAALVNTATIVSNNVSLVTATATADVAEPMLSISKTDDLGTTAQAGTVVPYTVVFGNATAADASPAYGVVFTDTLDTSDLSLNVNSLSANVAGSFKGSTSSEIIFTPTAALLPGQTVDVNYTGTVLDTATPGEVLVNDAYASYDTQLGGEDVLSTPTVSASQTVALAPTITKSIVAVSDSTLGFTPTSATVEAGESVTYALTVQPGAGTQSLVVDDLLPTGLTFQSASVQANTDGVSAGALSASSVAGGLQFNLGTATVAPGSAPIVVDVTALVAAGATGTLDNQATVTSAAPVTGAGSATATSNIVPVTLVQPDLTITKTASIGSGQAGDVVTYTLTIAPSASDENPAYDLDITDAIPAGLTLVQGSEAISGGDGNAIDGVSDTPTSLTVTSSKLTGLTPLVVTYKATLSDNDINGQVVANVADLAYSSQPTGGTTANTVSAPADVTVALTDTVAKTLGGTSEGVQVLPGSATPGVIAGEEVTFFITATLGHGAQNLTLADQLPAGLDYQYSDVVYLGGTTGSALEVGQPGNFANGTVTFALGNVDNPGTSASSQVVVAVTALVDPADAVSTTTTADTITNVGTLVAGSPTNSPYTSANPLNETLLSPVTIEVVPTGTVEGRVFVNDACDGLYHVGDATVAGVTVELIDSSNDVLQTTKTDGTGNYSFGNVGPGPDTVKFILPNGLSFTEKDAGAAAISSQVNPTTGVTDAFSATSGGITEENAGVYLNGNFTGQSPTTIGAGTSYSANYANAIVVGTGADNIHTNAGNNVILIGSTGSDGGDVVETSPGNDIVYACGTGGTNAQALGTTDYIFGGGGNGVLQGGSGSDYLMAGPGDYTLAGGSGASTLVSGPNSGTVTVTNGTVTNYTVGDEIREGNGTTKILFQAGDGVDLLDTFNPSVDSITIYGYSGAQSVSQVNGHTVVYLGGNDAIVFNDVYNSSTTSLPGITFVPDIPATPTLVLTFGANGMPVLSAPTQTSSNIGYSYTTVAATSDTGTLVGQSPNQRLVAGNGSTYTLIGGSAGQDVLVGGTGNDVLIANGSGNAVELGDGSNTVVGGTSATTSTGGNGNNTYWLSGSGNAVTAGDGNNIVVMTNGATGSVTLGNGANLIFAYGGSGDVFQLGTGDNTVFAEINSSTITAGNGDAFVFGNDNTIDITAPVSSVVAVQGIGNTTDAGNGDLLLFQSGGTVDVGTGTHQLFVSGTAVSITAQGSNTIVGPSGDATVTITGTGTQLIGLGGTGNTISVQDGSAAIWAGQGNDTVNLTGSGTDTVTLGVGDTVEAGTGANAIYLAAGGSDVVALAAQSASNDLYGFGSGDTVDLSKVLANIAADLTKVGNYVTLQQSGSDVLVGLNASGAAGGTVKTIADLHGVGTSVVQLSGSHLTYA